MQIIMHKIANSNSVSVQSRSTETSPTRSFASLPLGSKFPKRSLAGATQQWEALKPIIIGLYQVHGVELKEVRTIMQNRHGFDATQQSYKRRLRAWNVRKNYSLRQKLVILDQRSTTGSDPPQVNGKPLQVDRLRRFVQKNGRPMKIVACAYLPAATANKSSINCSASAVKEDASRQASYINANNAKYLSIVHLQQPPEDHAMNHVLYHAKSYYQWYFAQGEIQSVGEHHWSLCEVFNLLRSVLSKLSTRPAWAFKILNQVCASAERILRSQPHQVIVLFGAYLSWRQWAQHLEIRSAIISFYKQMAVKVLGPSHNLPKMLKLMEDRHISEGVCRRFGHLAADVARSDLLRCTSDFIEYLVDLKALSFETGEHTDMDLNFIVSKVGRSEGFREHVRILYALGYLRYWEDRLPEAKYWLLEVMKLVETHEADFWRHQRGAAFLMGRVLDKEGNVVESARYFRLGIDLSVTPHADPDRYDGIKSLELLEHLENFYIRQGNKDAAAGLRTEFNFLWAAHQRE